MRTDPWWKLWSSLIASFSDVSIPGQRRQQTVMASSLCPSPGIALYLQGTSPFSGLLGTSDCVMRGFRGLTQDISAVPAPGVPAVCGSLHLSHIVGHLLPLLSPAPLLPYTCISLGTPLTLINRLQASLYCREYFQGSQSNRHHCRLFQ